ncbi:MAG: histidinol dehydrogenase [Oscillospiraceae bacterium]|nr:histidinol dehydrogenase [Oscillospiraceae bacterium]
MLKRFIYENNTDIAPLLERRGVDLSAAEAAAREILEAVKSSGDTAVREYTKKFDRADIETFEIPRDEIDAAVKAVDSDLLASLNRAAKNIRAFHENQKQTGFIFEPRKGAVMGQRVTPLERVGVYVPGGTAFYPSTVLMDVIPAKIAGVDEIIMTTPPSSDGKVPAVSLAAAAIAGVDRVFRIGGAQAIGAMAYGTNSVPRVDKIVGPGNSYVAAAKRLVYGLVDIDMIAGPSDILVIADETAHPEFVASDLLGQAEHGADSPAILVTVSPELADKVDEALSRRIKELPRREMAESAIKDYGAAVIVKDLESAARVSNLLAPEHLELCVNDPWSLMPLIRNAGSIFLGHFTPEALGDYIAGPNHTLPTSGSARFSSPLSVNDFQKKSSYLHYDRNALADVASDLTRIAHSEGLDAHAKSVEVRL